MTRATGSVSIERQGQYRYGELLPHYVGFGFGGAAFPAGWAGVAPLPLPLPRGGAPAFVPAVAAAPVAAFFFAAAAAAAAFLAAAASLASSSARRSRSASSRLYRRYASRFSSLSRAKRLPSSGVMMNFFATCPITYMPGAASSSFGVSSTATSCRNEVGAPGRICEEEK